MKNNKKGDSAKIEMELLLRKALRVQQEPSQQLNDSIIRQCEKRNEQGADQILGDGRIVIGIERDNHKEIENCQNQKKDEEIKVVDYSQFEASTKSGIHADVNRIRQKDEIIRAVVKKRRNSAITCVCFVCMAGRHDGRNRNGCRSYRKNQSVWKAAGYNCLQCVGLSL